MPIPKSVSRWADGFWLLALGAYILAGAALAPFHGDESTLIFMGRDYHYLFLEGDLSKVLYDDAWSRRPDEQRLRLENGSISKTIYGWLAANQGIESAELNEPWHWGRDYDFNARTNRLPEERLLNAARLASALQLALAVVAFFLFVKLTLDKPTAYLASALFVLHPNLLINGRRAMMEGSHLLGLTLALLAAAWLLRERNWWRFGLLGLCLGAAMAAKHPNALAAALVCLALSMALWRRAGADDPAQSAGGWRLGVMLFAAFVVAASVFLLLNPAWWSAPLAMPALIIEMRAELLRLQVELFGGYESFLERLQGFFHYVFAAERQYFEVARWAEYEVIGGQIERYESSGLAGLLIGGTPLAGLISLALAAIGAASLARGSAISADGRTLLLVWILGSALSTLLLTPLPWARYYLPLAPALIILLARALVVLASAIRERYRSRTDGLALLD